MPTTLRTAAVVWWLDGAPKALEQRTRLWRVAEQVLRQMLPLPALRAGYLWAADPGSDGSPPLDERWRRRWFLLDADSLRSVPEPRRSAPGPAPPPLPVPPPPPAAPPAHPGLRPRGGVALLPALRPPARPLLLLAARRGKTSTTLILCGTAMWNIVAHER